MSITITVSRQLGAGGTQIASRLSGLLGLRLVDRQILDRVAEALIDRETLDGGEFESLVLGEEASRAPEGQGQPRPTPFAGVPVSAAASEPSKGKPEV